MYSIGEVSERLKVPDKRLYKWVKRYNLGQKVGFGWVLFEKDLGFLREKLANGNKKAA